MRVPEHVRTATAAYVASASCVAGGLAVYILLSHRARKLQRKHEDELYEIEQHYQRQLRRAYDQVAASRKANRPGTWVGTIRDTVGGGMAEPHREVGEVGPDGSPLAIEADYAPASSFSEESFDFVSTDREVLEESVQERGEESTDEHADLGDDSTVQGQTSVRSANDFKLGRPYVISTAEFSEDKPTYQKLSVKYYSGDRVLVDDQDQPVPDIRGTIGPNIKQRFGRKSDSPHTVHIRNDRLEADFEVCHDERSYAEVVLSYGNPTLSGSINQQAEE